MQQPSINKEPGQEQGRKIRLMPKATLRSKRSDSLPFTYDLLRTAEQYSNVRLENKQGDAGLVKSPNLHPAGFSLPHVENSQKRIRVYFGGVCVIDTTKAKLVYVHAYFAMATDTLYFGYSRIQ